MFHVQPSIVGRRPIAAVYLPEAAERRRDMTGWATSGFLLEGVLGDWAPEFAGRAYRVDLSARGEPIRNHAGAVLCKIWDGDPDDGPAQLMFLPPTWLESDQGPAR
jgi:hypothetical protein